MVGVKIVFPKIIDEILNVKVGFYLTVTLFARLRGLSGSFFRKTANWYARIWTGMMLTIGEVNPLSGTLIQ